ncbi:MAG: anhydro-N-acetylmuramic acid kinase [Bacteroidetes bacterium]|nr:anhydro-N-acetylmuramic acid kinase [Bacteroidota bacterium]
MSGTSLDGLDVALCAISGAGLNTRIQVLQFETVPYSAEVKEKIAEVFAKQLVNFEKLCLLHPYIGILHGQMVLDCLRLWKLKPDDIDVIASHGQTVYHAPGSLSPHQDEQLNATLQIGDGDQVAVTTGILTLSDFRQKHIAKGGEGAPLAVYGDYLLFAHATENRILLNIGGIGNFTFLPGGQQAGRVFVTDTGPGNTLLDQMVRKHCPGEYYDQDARRAAKGCVSQGLLNALKQHPFFEMPFPKTTGPELFNLDYVKEAQLRSSTETLSLNDLLATLTRFSAETIVAAIRKATKEAAFTVYLSGGGAHNPLLRKWICELLQIDILQTTDALGISGDAKEAVLFALLANEALVGDAIDFGDRAKVPAVCMGKVSFPL